MNPRRSLLLGALVALALPLAGCGGDDGGTSAGGDPQQVLAAAKKNFDAASSVKFTLATDSKPSKGDAVLGATGTLTHQPAFEGSVKVILQGFTADVPVVAVDGAVHAKLPFSSGYAVIDPADYSAPDPADFADPSSGISGLLLKLDGLKKGKQVREGKQVLTSYTGTLPGSLVAPLIPSASSSGTYATVVGVDGDGRIATLAVTGTFFSGDDDVTYDLVFSDYDKNVTIKKP